MKTRLTLVVFGLCSALFQVAPTSAQVSVRSGTESVVIDGDQVRIQDAEDTVVIAGDWRSAGTVYTSSDTDRLLVELGGVSIGDRVRLDLAGDILFDLGSAAIRAAAEEHLAKVAHLIRAQAIGEAFIIGHTDALGSVDSNLDLSRERSLAVMRWLRDHEGIPLGAMVGSGQGEARPIAHNTNTDGSDNPEGRARNRRVEIQLATREGVRIGPDIVIGADDSVSVAGVHVAADDSVTVGNVAIDPDGNVSLGGIDLGSAAAAAVAGSGGCSAGRSCTDECTQGDCKFNCPAGAVCDFSCKGGDCQMDCSAGANCSFSCSGGDCIFTSATGANLRTSCSGGDCVCRGAGC